MGYFHTDEELEHHGILGQKWGVRRYQNPDGTLTEAGRKKYGEKVTMHNGKDNILLGGRKYQTHKEYVTANKYAKASYNRRKEEIRDWRKDQAEKGEKFTRVKAISKNLDAYGQYRYEKDRNRINAGVNESKRDFVKGVAGKTAAATAVVGANVLAGMIHANYLNNRLKKESVGRLGAQGIEQYYEYKIGKEQVAKYLVNSVAMGALYGATSGLVKNVQAQQRIDNLSANEKRRRARIATEDEKRWKKGMV